MRPASTKCSQRELFKFDDTVTYPGFDKGRFFSFVQVGSAAGRPLSGWGSGSILFQESLKIKSDFLTFGAVCTTTNSLFHCKVEQLSLLTSECLCFPAENYYDVFLAQ